MRSISISLCGSVIAMFWAMGLPLALAEPSTTQPAAELTLQSVKIQGSLDLDNSQPVVQREQDGVRDCRRVEELENVVAVRQ